MAEDPAGREGIKPHRRIRYWVAGGVALLILATIAMLFGPWLKQGGAAQLLAADQASSGKEPSRVEDTKPPNPAPKPKPASAPLPRRSASETPRARVPHPPAPGEKSHASILANDRSWVVACADNKLLFAKLFTDATREDIEFKRVAVVRVGRPNAVQINVNGRPVALSGGVSDVRVVELTPEDSGPLQDGAPNDCTHGL